MTNSVAVTASMFKSLPYDTLKDFEPVGLVASLPQILVANTAVPVRTVADVVAQAKAAPDKSSFASVGNGSPGHLAGELMVIRTGAPMLHIPYRGGGPAMLDLLAGRLDFMFATTATALPHIAAGRLRALAVPTEARLPALPAVPTMAESGFAAFALRSWFGVMAPARTPPGLIAALNQAIGQAMTGPEVAAQLAEHGESPLFASPAEFRRMGDADQAQWGKLALAHAPR